MIPSLQSYRLHFNALCAGQESDEGKIAAHRDELLHRYEAMKSLPKDERLQQLFDEMKRYHDIVLLQGLLGQQLPLKKLLDAAAQRKDENGELVNFVEQLYKNRVPVSLLHNALKALVEHAKKRQADLGSLEDILQQHWEGIEKDSEDEWSLFETPDSHYLACHPIQDKHWYRVNEALPLLIQARAKRHREGTLGHCLPLPSQVDKLHTQLGGAEWVKRLHFYLTTVIAWLKWLREKSVTPTLFKPEFIFFNDQHRLTALKEMRPGPYDALAMETFAWQIARGDPGRFKHILEASGLGQHPHAKFIKEVVQEAMRCLEEGGKMEEAWLMQKAAHCNMPRDVRDAAYATASALIKLKEECSEEITALGHTPIFLAAKISHLYHETGGHALILAQVIKERVLKSVMAS